ncbi:NlpC/P60 family protein [Embleya scabrispora]|uniref:NlpC/P60 family protein n=1 Tax=Embleya scabrispora TaxID=159449 RepID=UPI00037CBBF7|nr:lytic transglycosylase domain-containing protein [Embleya scabrispora]MYS87377.1 transglycosylase SLT domain-containing protein [Streptomyces sp. SID5474]
MQKKKKKLGLLLILPSGGFLVFVIVMTALIAATNPLNLLRNPLANAAFNANAVPPQFRSFVAETGNVCPEVTPTVVAAQIDQESGWRPSIVSPAGAVGLSQFMPGTWATWGGGAAQTDPRANIMAQERYDCHLAGEVRKMQAGKYGTCTMVMHGKVYTKPGPKAGEMRGEVFDLMLASYNAGPGAVCYYRGIPPWDETEGYVPGIKNIMSKYSAPQIVSAVYSGDNKTLGGRAVNLAKASIGKYPYSWGGGSFTGPSEGFAQGAGIVGFDCSGFVRYLFHQASGGALKLPRTAGEQAGVGQRILSSVGPPSKAEEAKMQPGDVIFFTTSGGRIGTGATHHTALYVGNGMTINALKTGTIIREDPFSRFLVRGAQDVWTVQRYAVATTAQA